jgi:hypothetical protein
MINAKLDKILKVLAPDFSFDTAPKKVTEETKPAISAGKKEKVVKNIPSTDKKKPAGKKVAKKKK